MKKIILLLFFTSLSSAQVEIIENFAFSQGKITNNKVVFVRETPEHGRELWVSNGTPGSAQLLKDIVPGSQGSFPELGYEIDDLVYFKINTGHIWRTDGTANGTYAMENNAQIIKPLGFVKAGQFIFFHDQGKLWKMQSTSNSESLVTTPMTLNFSQISGLVKLDENEVIFNGKLANTGKWAIYRTNGVVIELVKDINTGIHPNTSSQLEYEQMWWPKNIDNTVYFDGYSSEFQGELWKTNGTSSGTTMVKDIYTNNDNPFQGSSGSRDFTKLGSEIYFSARSVGFGYELWKTDKNDGGTQMVKDIHIGNNINGGPYSLTPANNNLYFIQTNSDNPGNSQIWKTDGTENGTIAITTLPNSYLFGIELFYHNNFIYFSLWQSTTGAELWRLNTLNDTYSLIEDIAPETVSSSPGGFYFLNDYIYFTAYSDGTIGGTKTYRIPADLNLGIESNSLKNKISIYPNPTSNLLNIDIDNATNFEAIIYDVVGKEVGTYKNQKTINVTALRNGIYFIKLKTDDAFQTKTIKWIKQ